MKRLFAPLLTMLLVSAQLASAGADVTPIDGTWLVGGRVAIDVFDCQGLLCGRVAWLRRAALRTPELCGATIVYGLKSTGPTQWAGGTFIDPEDGHTYDLTATLQADGTISARIYEGIAMFGKTEILHRIQPHSFAGWC